MTTFLKITKIFSLNSLHETLKNRLINTVYQENACFLYGVLLKTSRKDIVLSLFNYLKQYFTLITEENQHLTLNFDLIKEILLSSDLRVTSEIEVANAVNTWLKHDQKERSKHAMDLLKAVRLPFLPTVDLKRLLNRNYYIFEEFEACKTYIQNEIEKKKGFRQQAAISYKPRHCKHHSFFMIGCKNSRYQIYQVAKDNLTLPVKNVREILNGICLLMNGILYLFNNDEIKSYSTFTNEWRDVKRFPGYRFHYSACSFMGKIYILGGTVSRKNKASDCICFDPRTNKFKQIKCLKENRRQSACAVFEGRIVVSGGQDSTKYSKNTVEVYDHINNRWCKMPEMLYWRHSHTSLTVGNKLFMLGGGSLRCEMFDSLSNSFVYIQDVFPLPKWNGMYRNHSVSVCKFVIWGSGIVVINNHTLDAAIYDVEKEEWSEVDDFNNIKSIDINGFKIAMCSNS